MNGLPVLAEIMHFLCIGALLAACSTAPPPREGLGPPQVPSITIFRVRF